MRTHFFKHLFNIQLLYLIFLPWKSLLSTCGCGDVNHATKTLMGMLLSNKLGTMITLTGKQHSPSDEPKHALVKLKLYSVIV